jgi:ACS family tartrate transporter-like MFS transporter
VTTAGEPGLEARVCHKLMWRIIPFVMLLYFVSFLDRVNVGFAAIDMNPAIGLSSAAYGLGSGLFFIGYFLFEVPSNLLLHRVGARVWIARVMVSWGIVAAAMAFVTGPASFYVLRFILGIAEAGFFPGIIFYLSTWFPRRQRAIAAAWFMAAAPISTAIGGPISGAIMQMPAIAGLANWQWLFIIEALPAVVLGFVVLKFLTDKPADAHWLADDERNWLIGNLAQEAATRAALPDHKSGALQALRDPRVLGLAVIYFGTSTGLYTLGLWGPLMVHQQGFSAFATGLFTAVPGVATIAAMVLWARHSDRSQERTWHVILPCLVGCGGFVLAGLAQSPAMLMLALILANIGVGAPKAPLWAWSATFLSGAGAAAGIALINSIANLGGFVGPYAIGRLKEMGGFSAGLNVVGATLAVSALVAWWLSRQRPATDH